MSTESNLRLNKCVSGAGFRAQFLLYLTAEGGEEGVKELQPSKHTHSEVRKGRKEIINWSCCFNYSLRGERGGLW